MEDRINNMVEKGVYSGRDGYIMGGSHNIIVAEKGVYSGREV